MNARRPRHAVIGPWTENTAVATSEASLKLAQDEYAAGRGSLLQVLDAQRLYGQALLGHAHAKGQRYLDTILARGGTGSRQCSAERALTTLVTPGPEGHPAERPPARA